eukprot:COSAG01_NODE_5203_length_4414_cov_3.702897_4_plen_169_part_00
MLNSAFVVRFRMVTSEEVIEPSTSGVVSGSPRSVAFVQVTPPTRDAKRALTPSIAYRWVRGGQRNHYRHLSERCRGRSCKPRTSLSQLCRRNRRGRGRGGRRRRRKRRVGHVSPLAAFAILVPDPGVDEHVSWPIKGLGDTALGAVARLDLCGADAPRSAVVIRDDRV